MRAFLSLLVILAFTAPAMASDMTDAKKPVLIKGTKSYQVRYSKPSMSPSMVEPAAGVEEPVAAKDKMAAQASDMSEKAAGKKVMKLHGKK